MRSLSGRRSIDAMGCARTLNGLISRESTEETAALPRRNRECGASFSIRRRHGDSDSGLCVDDKHKVSRAAVFPVSVQPVTVRPVGGGRYEPNQPNRTPPNAMERRRGCRAGRAREERGSGKGGTPRLTQKNARPVHSHLSSLSIPIGSGNAP